MNEDSNDIDDTLLKCARHGKVSVTLDIIGIYPMMPTKYSPAKRRELRKFEKKLLNGKKVKI